MTNSINRRQAIKALASATAVTATATTVLASTTDADQHLIDLFDEWRGLQRAILDTTEKSDKAEFAARKEYPEPPLSITWRGASTEKRILMDRVDIQKWIDSQRAMRGPKNQTIEARYESMVAAMDKHEADKERICQRHKLPALLKVLGNIVAKQKAVETELINTPAKGLIGVQVKLSFWAFWNFDDGLAEHDFTVSYPYPESHAIRQALIDLQRLTGQTIKATV